MKTFQDFVAPQPGEATPLPVYRALENLHLSGDMWKEMGLPPEEAGKIHTWRGDTTTLFWPLRKYKDRIELLIQVGAIERIVLPTIASLDEQEGEK